MKSESESENVSLEKYRSSLKLVSPNGRYTIELRADDNGAGVWIYESDEPKAHASLYNGYNQGAVVAVGDPDKYGAYPIAMSAGGPHEVPVIQIVQQYGKVTSLDLDGCCDVCDHDHYIKGD